MSSILQTTFSVAVIGVLLGAAGCKSDSSYREREKTQGEEVEAMEDRGNVAIDAADDADE